MTMIMTMTMIMIMIMIMITIMIMILSMIMSMIMTMIKIKSMVMTMVSYHHHEAPRAVRGSVVGSSMDMWCPYGIGREIWDRVMRMLIDQDPSPLKGEISLAGVFPFAGVSGSSPRE